MLYVVSNLDLCFEWDFCLGGYVLMDEKFFWYIVFDLMNCKVCSNMYFMFECMKW